VVDCAHGAAYNVAPHVFHELGADVTSIGVKPDGLNINDQTGATAPAALRQQVLDRQADLGIGLDGDADRVVIIDASRPPLRRRPASLCHREAPREQGKGERGGRHADDQPRVRERDAAPGNSVRPRGGGRPLRARDDAREGWELGGEKSGHVICLDKHTTGDGIVSALQVLHAMRETRASLAELTADLVMFPQVLVNVKVPRGFRWENHQEILTAQADAERSLNGRGRVLLRPSGTEPVLRVMVEGEPKEAIESAAHSIAAAVRSPRERRAASKLTRRCQLL
jgi:phosphoglucosamine mutase